MIIQDIVTKYHAEVDIFDTTLELEVQQNTNDATSTNNCNATSEMITLKTRNHQTD